MDQQSRKMRDQEAKMFARFNSEWICESIGATLPYIRHYLEHILHPKGHPSFGRISHREGKSRLSIYSCIFKKCFPFHDGSGPV